MLFRTRAAKSSLLSGVLFFALPFIPLKAGSTNLPSFDFENGKLDGWVVESNDGATKISVVDGEAGKGLKLERSSSDSSSRPIYGPSVALPSSNPFLISRTVKISGSVKGPAFSKDRLELRVLWSTPSNNGWASLIDSKGGGAETLPLQGNGDAWTRFETSVPLVKDVQSFRLYFFLKGESGAASATVDNLKLSCQDETGHLIKSSFKGNIIPEDSGSISVETAPGKALGGEASLFDETGAKLFSAPVPPEGKMELPLAKKGFYSIEVAVRYEDGSELKTRSSAAVVGKPLPEDVRMASKYGFFTVHMPEEIAVIAGSRWNWGFWSVGSYVRDASGAFNIPPLNQDRPKPKLSLHNSMNGSLPKSITGFEPGKGLHPPKDWDLFYDLMKAWAEKRASSLDLITVCNEPDAGWKGTDEEMVKFHSVAAKAIKAGAPGTKVYGPCFYSIRMPYLRKLVSMGLLDDLDGLTLHAYVDGTAPEEEFIQRVFEVKDFLKSIGKESMPVHLTEFGWTSALGTWQKPVDELTQARYASRSLALLSATGVDSIIYFCGLYNCANPGETGFSICNVDLTPKPSYPAMAMALKTLAPLGTDGRWLKLSPGSNLVVHKKASGASLGIAWSTDGKGSLDIVEKAVSVSDMEGRPLPLPPPGSSIALGQSPIYLELEGSALREMPLLNPSVACAGSSLDLPPGDWTVQAPKPLAVSGSKLLVPQGAALGDYLVVLKDASSSVIKGWPLRITTPVTLEDISLAWPASSESPLLNVACHAAADLKSGGKLSFSSGSAKPFESPMPAMKAGSDEAVQVQLGAFQPGVAVKGSVKAELLFEGKPFSVSKPCSFTVVPCLSLKAFGSEAGMELGDSLSSGSWTAFGMKESKKPSADDCSASMRVAYSDEGLILHVDVKDSEHSQPFQGDAIWGGDSLQISFDSDADRPWQPNNMNFGFNGHRIFEYGVALGDDGTPKLWRWIAYDPQLRPGAPEGVKARIVREGSTTKYRLLFSWASLGLDKAPAPGSSLGFSLAVNDKDSEGGRHGLYLFGGIIEGKDPRAFGRIWLR